jgi:hypothetical protein
MKIKIGRSDKRGVNGWIKGNVLYLEGSDHWWDWLHHVLPGAAWRERRMAREEADKRVFMKLVKGEK